MASAPAPQHQFKFPRDVEGTIDVGRLSDVGTSGAASSLLLEPRGHHHYIRGRSAEELNSERVSSAEVMFPFPFL